MQKPGYVYILTNKTKTVLYIGVTSDLAKRIHQHMNGLGSSFAAKYNLKFLVYLEVFDSITTAIEREKLLKGKTRKKKQAIISSLNPRWQDLSDSVL